MRATRLVQLTDTHLFGDATARLRGVCTAESLRRVLRHAAASISAADAILATGDLVQDDATGYAQLRAQLAPLGKPALCLPGNHDALGHWTTALAGAPFHTGQWHDFGAWRIVMLDSAVAGSDAGHLGPAQFDVLDSALRGSVERPTLVCVHHQPVPVGSRWLDAIGIDNGAELLAVLRQHPQARGVLWGHVHQAFDAEQDGLRLMATPSTCFQFAPRVDEFAGDDRPPGYRVLELHADGRIDTEVRWVG